MAYNFELITPQYLQEINADNFETIALSLFQYQYQHNPVYKEFVDTIKVSPAAVGHLDKIPFLPVSFFKTHRVVTGTFTEELLFESSGTTSDTPSKHYVKDAALYKQSLLQGFNEYYGTPDKYAILALLPSYLERENASLVHMAKVLMEESKHPDNGFYLDEWDQLQETLTRLEAEKQPTILLGVTFALLDFAYANKLNLSYTTVMETGGMKGREEEWTRQQIHSFLKKRWQLPAIASEYGMTELLSQAYASADGIFEPTTTMRVMARDLNDPMEIRPTGNGCLNIIDLANVHSCAFIATEDIGNIAKDGTFEVLGRMDEAAQRGCNLMVV